MNRRALLLAAALLAAWPAPAADAAGQGSCTPQAGAAAAPAAPAMERDACCRQFIASCHIDGRPARLLVDTGATHTVLDTTFAARELPALEKLEGVRLVGNAKQAPTPALATLQAGGRTLAKSLVLLIDLRGVNSLLAEPIDGILGMAHLGQLPFTLDLRSGRGSWEAGSAAGAGTPAGAAPRRLQGKADETGRLYLPARSSGGARCLLLLDSGSTTTTWPRGQWAAGEEDAHGLRQADINGQRNTQGAKRGLPAPLELAGGLVLPRVRPLLQAGDSGHLLGLDALEGCRLIHRPGQGFYLELPSAADTPPLPTTHPH